MKKIIIVTHYTLAQGYQETLAGLTGDKKIVTAICAYMNNEGTNELKEKVGKILNNSDEFYILTDLSFGSVNQVMSQFASAKIHIITGVNLPFALALALAVKNDQPINITKLINQARQQLLQVSVNDITDSKDDE